MARRRVRCGEDRRGHRRDQHVLDAARTRLDARTLRRQRSRDTGRVPRPLISCRPPRPLPRIGAVRTRRAAERKAAGAAHGRRGAGRTDGGGVFARRFLRARRRCRHRRTRCCAAQSALRGHLLHPLYLRLDRGAQGRDLGARPAHRQRLRYRRAHASDGGRPRLARGAAVLVVRIGQCAAGTDDPWRCDRAAGELRAGRGDCADRARTLHRLLRHGQYGAGDARASLAPRASARRDAHRPHDRAA